MPPFDKSSVTALHCRARFLFWTDRRLNGAFLPCQYHRIWPIKIDHLMPAQFIKLTEFCIIYSRTFLAYSITAILHSMANAEIRDSLFSCIFHGKNHPVNPTIPKPPGISIPSRARKQSQLYFLRDSFRIRNPEWTRRLWIIIPLGQRLPTEVAHWRGWYFSATGHIPVLRFASCAFPRFSALSQAWVGGR